MSVAGLREWMVEQALPLWGHDGFDAREEQFVEQIALDGTPLLDSPRRVMVQARQIYVFGQAYSNGWFPSGKDLAEAAYRQLVRRYGAEGGTQGWAFSTSRDGAIIDPRRDLYAQAFVLLALATIASLGGGEEPLQLARETLTFLDEEMEMAVGGYSEVLPHAAGPRRQNPHMHLFEALLALHAVAPDQGFDRRAWQIAGLLDRRFVVRQDGNVALVEYFDDALLPAGGPDFGFEPGHHFEWVWLLAECERLTGRRTRVLAGSLWNSAMRFGFRDDGAIFDEVSISGALIGAGTRLWPLTEALKAFRSGFAIPQNAVVAGVDDIAEALAATFLRPAPAGLWLDHFDGDGKPTRDTAPASSLYHLCCALSQFEGASDTGKAHVPRHAGAALEMDS